MKSKGRPLSRRDFLKTSTVAIGGTLLAACAKPLTLPTQESMPTAGSIPTATGAPTPAPSNVEVVMYGAAGRVKTFSGVGERYMQKNPGTTVNWTPVQAGEWNEYFIKVVTMLAAGLNVDLCEVGTEGMQLLASKGVLAPLDDYVTDSKDYMQEYFSDVAPQMMEVMLYDGHLYNLPWLHGAAIIFYNKKLFAQAGHGRPPDDWTVADFLQIAKDIHALGDDVYGFGFPNRLWGGIIPWWFLNDTNMLTEARKPGGEWFWNEFYADNPIAKGRGGGMLWEGSRANDPKTIEGAQFLQDLIWKDKVAPGPADLGVLATFFSTHKLGMMGAHRFLVGVLKNAGMTPDDFDIAYYPKWKGQRHQFGAGGMALLTRSENKAGGWDFLKHMITRDEMYRYVEGGVHTSARRSVTNDPAQSAGIGPEHYDVFYGPYDKAMVDPIPAPPEANDMTSIMTKYVGLAMANEMTAEEAMNAMHVDLEAMFKRSHPA